MIPAADHPATSQATPGFRRWVLAFGVSLLVTLPIVAPFFWKGVASGHDFEFHATSWLDVAGQWKDGILFPRWAEWANYGFGEPRFIFYPPLSWLLGPALSFLVSWEYVPVVFIVLVQAFAGLAAFAFAKRFVCDRAALFAALFYAANPYALLMIYFRSDYAELLASSFFPLLFLTALQITGLVESSEPSIARKIVFVSVAFAGVWLSNAPAGVLATYSVTLMFVLSTIARRSWAPLVRGAGGLALGWGLASFYLVPAAYEQRWVNIGQALGPGLIPSENFLYTAVANPEHTFFNYIASTVAVGLILVAGIAAIAVRRQNANRGQETNRERLWWSFLVLAAVSAALMLRPTAFLWQQLPKLRFVQFPWRWMSILTIPLVYFLAVAVGQRRRGWLWIACVLGLLVGTGTFLVRETWWDDEEFTTLRATIASGEGYFGTDEYDPVDDDHYNLPQNAPAASIVPTSNESMTKTPADQQETKIFFEEWTPETRDIRVRVTKRSRLALRLLNYPAWRVEVNGSPAVVEDAGDTGQMIISVPEGDSRVTVRFMRTPDRTAGGIISIASFALSVFLARRKRTEHDLPFG